MAFFGFSDYNFGTEGPRDLKFDLLASPEDGLQGTRPISDILDFGDCTITPGSASYALNTFEPNENGYFLPFLSLGNCVSIGIRCKHSKYTQYYIEGLVQNSSGFKLIYCIP